MCSIGVVVLTSFCSRRLLSSCSSLSRFSCNIVCSHSLASASASAAPEASPANSHFTNYDGRALLNLKTTHFHSKLSNDRIMGPAEISVNCIMCNSVSQKWSIAKLTDENSGISLDGAPPTAPNSSSEPLFPRQWDERQESGLDKFIGSTLEDCICCNCTSSSCIFVT